MLFRQLAARRGDSLTYLIGCPRSRQALLVDPVLSEERRYRSMLEGLGMNLRWVIETSLPDPQTDVASYASLLEMLGTAEALPGQTPIHELLGAHRVGPLESLDDSEQNGPTQEVEVGLDTARLWIHPTTPPSGVTPPVDSAMVYPRLGLRLGTVPVDVWVPARCRIVVAVADRVMTGGVAYAGRPAPIQEDPTFRPVLGLSADTLIYPGRAPNGIRVSSVGQERVWLQGALVREATPLTMASTAPLPVGAVDSGPDRQKFG
jgi:hypothetical protein